MSKPDVAHSRQPGNGTQRYATDRDGLGASRDHLAYLLRVWCVARSGEAVWLASLEDVDTGERRGFVSLKELFAYLSQETTRGAGPARAEGCCEERG